MECKKCGEKINDKYSFCPFCGQKICSNRDINANTGNNSVNIGVGCESINDIYVENINMSIDKSDTNEQKYIKYQDFIRFNLPGNIKTIDHINKISIVLSIISAIITIITFLFDIKSLMQHYNILIISFLFFTWISLYFWITKKELNKNGSTALNRKGMRLVLKDKKIVITNKVGKCLICGGNVYIRYNKELQKTLGTCTNNNEHTYSYDPSVGIGILQDIKQIYFKQN